MRGLVIAGTHSGVGKTTLTMGLLAAFSARGLRVQPYKIGPDYLDPLHHQNACGVPCRNLDTWLLSSGAMLELFARASHKCDLAMVEGVMGLYDGASGEDDAASTAAVSKLLGLPVILVVDASASTRSVGAAVLGFRQFDPDVRIAGVILNGIAGAGHLELVRTSIERSGLPLLGYLPHRPEFKLPERHLGLVASLAPEGGGVAAAIAAQLQETVSIAKILELAGETRVPAPALKLFPEEPVRKCARVAVALDEAFHFYYQDALDLLEAWGAELTFFSPLRDSDLPEGIGGVYLGGGYPEAFARPLSENRPMLQSLRRAADASLPIYAECGGLMYLCRGLEDEQAKVWPMVGLLPATAGLAQAKLTVGYRTVEALQSSWLLPAGTRIRGHEFHLSQLDASPSPQFAAYRLLGHDRNEGYRIGRTLASYVHLHFGSLPGLARRMVQACRTAGRF